MPTMRWHPETGESAEFGPNDGVPEGWLDHHPDDATKHVPAAAEPAAWAAPKPPETPEGKGDDPNAPLLKREVVAAMKMGGLAFNENDKVGDLTDQLVVALKAALKHGNVAFAEDASPRALLALVSVK